MPDEGTFHLFAKLPKELRLQIWNFALIPRVIPLHRINYRLKGRGVYYPKPKSTVGFMALSSSHPSYDILCRVCPEAQLLCRRRFVNFEVWDVRKNCLGTPYNPTCDVVYFSHSIDVSILLDFAVQNPDEASSLAMIALPGIISSDKISRSRISRKEVLAALHAFDNLVEVIIIVGSESNRRENGSWLGGTEDKACWVLPSSAEEALEELKHDEWPDWKVPIVTVVGSQEEIMRRRDRRLRRVG